MSTFLNVRWDSSPSSLSFLTKLQGKEGQYIPDVGNKVASKEEDIGGIIILH